MKCSSRDTHLLNLAVYMQVFTSTYEDHVQTSQTSQQWMLKVKYYKYLIGVWDEHEWVKSPTTMVE